MISKQGRANVIIIAETPCACQITPDWVQPFSVWLATNPPCSRLCEKTGSGEEKGRCPTLYWKSAESRECDLISFVLLHPSPTTREANEFSHYLAWFGLSNSVVAALGASIGGRKGMNTPILRTAETGSRAAKAGHRQSSSGRRVSADVLRPHHPPCWPKNLIRRKNSRPARISPYGD